MMDEMINETIMLQTETGTIETNHIEYTMGEPEGESYYVFSVNMYSDLQNGVMVEMNFNSERMLWKTKYSFRRWKLTGYDIASIPEFSDRA
jgi:predicted ATP-binding protein involved in virulence